jgi:hypothetical protein
MEHPTGNLQTLRPGLVAQDRNHDLVDNLDSAVIGHVLHAFYCT